MKSLKDLLPNPWLELEPKKDEKVNREVKRRHLQHKRRGKGKKK